MKIVNSVLILIGILTGILFINYIMIFGINIDRLFISVFFNEYLLKNLPGEIVGIFVTAVIIDNIMSRKERAKREKLKKIALNSLREPLKRQAQILYGLGKSAMESFDLDDNIYMFNSQTFFDIIKFVDFTSNATIVPKISWNEYFFSEFLLFKEHLLRTLDIYLSCFEPEVIQGIESIIGLHLDYLKNVKVQKIFEMRSNLFLFKDFVNSYCLLLKFYNENSKEEIVLEDIKIQYDMLKIFLDNNLKYSA